MALTRDKQILIAVVVLGGARHRRLLPAEEGREDRRQETISSAELPPARGTEDVDKLEITNGDKGVVVLEKKDEGKWWMTKPVPALGNQTNIKQMIDNLKELKATDLVAANAKRRPQEELRARRDEGRARGRLQGGRQEGRRPLRQGRQPRRDDDDRGQAERLFGERLRGLHVQPRREGLARHRDLQVRRRDRQHRDGREHPRRHVLHEGGRQVGGHASTASRSTATTTTRSRRCS